MRKHPLIFRSFSWATRLTWTGGRCPQRRGKLTPRMLAAVLRGLSQAKHRHNGVVRKAGEVNAYGALVDRQTHRIQHQ